jgi:hypothetical protein
MRLRRSDGTRLGIRAGLEFGFGFTLRLFIFWWFCFGSLRIGLTFL